jgi:TolB-like protein/class 3 adenylate cyclase
LERKLAAILAADVVGYAALMEADEAGTFARLRAGRKELFEPEVERHHGRIFKLMGDGLLAEFGSVVDAVECAVSLQRGMTERNSSVPSEKHIEVRIGINLGEVIVEGDDRYGEGVNVAARLQQLADPGGICVSGKVSKEVEKKLAFAFEPMGEQRMKNISEPIACFRVNLHPQQSHSASKPSDPAQSDPTRAAIAVLPFVNMSSDPEQEFFADGMAEDLITDLSKVKGLFVISRHSSFAFKGKFSDVRAVARDLGVRFVVEGSVRRAAMRVRINVQLIDAEDGTHIWAERFDREVDDIFALQDEVVGLIVNALSAAVPASRPIKGKRAANIKAYDLLVRGRGAIHGSLGGTIVGRPLLERAIELDPEFAEAYAWLAMSYLYGWVYWGENAATQGPLALRAAERAVALDGDNATAHAILGDVLIFDGRLDAGVGELTAALRIDPNHADAWLFMGEAMIYQGRTTEALDHMRKAFRANPYPPDWYYWYLGFGEYAAGNYEDTVEAVHHVAKQHVGSRRILAAALAQLGHLDEARAEAADFMAAYPSFSIEQWSAGQPFQHERTRQRFIEGYLMAGLPM